jgi:hypothetical protein
MKFDSLVALIALAPLAMADTTKIVSKCYTKLGKTSKANVATSSYALSFTFKVFQTITSTPSTTITPIAATVTTTQVVPSTTTTTLAQVTDTFTNTILETTTQVSTVVLPTSKLLSTYYLYFRLMRHSNLNHCCNHVCH